MQTTKDFYAGYMKNRKILLKNTETRMGTEMYMAGKYASLSRFARSNQEKKTHKETTNSILTHLL